MNLFCPACHSQNVSMMFDMGQQPLSLVSLQNVASQSHLLDRHPIQLAICHRCTHVHNILFNPAHVTYTDAGCRMFNNGSGWQEHLDQLRSRIEANSDVDLLVEIGAGDCEFLNSINTDAVKLAVDPCEAVEKAYEYGIQYTRAHFVPELHMPEGSNNTIVLMRHLLEHMEHPRDFVERIVQRAEEGAGPTTIIIEVPCCQKALDACRIEDWTYEHPQHFTVTSMCKLLRACGVTSSCVYTSYNGEVIVAIAAVEPKENHELEVACVIDGFRRVENNIDKMYGDWIYINLDDIAFWGGAGKSAMFLNKFLVSQHATVVDSHEAKWGYYVPGTSIVMKSPDILIEDPRKFIIATASWRAADIASEIKARGIKCERLLKFENGELTEVPLGQD